jgi:tetratricopeptide (TPR) repeat protein
VAGLGLLSGCLGKVLERQQAQIQRQSEELSRLSKEIEALREQQKKERERREACNRAFYEYEAARQAASPQAAIAHLRRGLDLCPEDDVAHNELGELYLREGRLEEATAEFEAALKINPRFTRARENLELAKKKAQAEGE